MVLYIILYILIHLNQERKDIYFHLSKESLFFNSDLKAQTQTYMGTFSD